MNIPLGSKGITKTLFAMPKTLMKIGLKLIPYMCEEVYTYAFIYVMTPFQELDIMAYVPYMNWWFT